MVSPLYPGTLYTKALRGFKFHRHADGTYVESPAWTPFYDFMLSEEEEEGK